MENEVNVPQDLAATLLEEARERPVVRPCLHQVVPWLFIAMFVTPWVVVLPGSQAADTEDRETSRCPDRTEAAPRQSTKLAEPTYAEEDYSDSCRGLDGSAVTVCKKLLTRWQLDPSILSPEFNWQYPDSDTRGTYGDTRGGLPYDPPSGWSKVAVNLEKYGSTDWMPDWAVAYHGPKSIVAAGEILRSRLEVCGGRTCNPFLWCGDGIYVSPNIDYATRFYADIETEKEDAEVVLFVRVLPGAHKTCKHDRRNWVVKGEPDDDMEDKVRVVAILFRGLEAS